MERCIEKRRTAHSLHHALDTVGAVAGRQRIRSRRRLGCRAHHNKRNSRRDRPDANAVLRTILHPAQHLAALGISQRTCAVSETFAVSRSWIDLKGTGDRNENKNNNRTTADDAVVQRLEHGTDRLESLSA